MSRKPQQLKDLLRPVRVALGPVSILVSVTAAVTQLAQVQTSCYIDIYIYTVYTIYTIYTIYTQLSRLSTSWTWQLLGLCSGAAVVASALLGGLVFRPDNSAVLELLAPVRTNQNTASSHVTRVLPSDWLSGGGAGGAGAQAQLPGQSFPSRDIQRSYSARGHAQCRCSCLECQFAAA